MDFFPDTIAAQSTPAGNAAIHIIRLSGAHAITVCEHYFSAHKPLSHHSTRKMVFGRFYDEDQLIDEVMIAVYHAPHSYTGENMAEIFCHGNQFIAQKILQILLKNVRLAEPGEFTQRAFLNNKMDLTQAEAVGDLLTAKTVHTHRIAVNQLEGKLYNKIKSFLDILTDLRIKLELVIDFPEDHLQEISYTEIEEKVDFLQNELKNMLAASADGVILRRGFRICLVGNPNVGKSSIFNAFLQSERAIVTPKPGTTRDYLEEAVSLNGFLIIFYDTAGLRETTDQVEMIGIKRSKDIINRSDLIIYVTDEHTNPRDLEHIQQQFPDSKLIKVINKTDLLSTQALNNFIKQGYTPCNTVTKSGLDLLKSQIMKMINIDTSALPEDLLTNPRQIAAAQRAQHDLSYVLDSLRQQQSMEFIAFDLLQVSKSLEEITGVITTDDILEKIFSNYCIGK